MNSVRACLIFLILSLTVGCSNSSMPGTQTGNGGSSNPPPGGASSVVISSILPASVAAGSPDFTITIVGKGFPTEPVDFKDHPAVFWKAGEHQNGVYLSVDNGQSDATHVTATVPASLVQNVGPSQVQVQIFFFADDTPKAVSNSIKFVVTN